jgi:DNA-binding Lrp family transcriptional regulator
MSSIDGLDGRIIALFATEPRIGVLEASRRLGVARGTVQARLDRLERDGVITGWAPSVNSGALGFPVSAFATLEIAQGHGHDGVAAHLRTIPEVLEAHTITGAADMMLRLVARSNSDLQRVIDQVVTSADVTRASTVIVLSSEVPMRMLPLVEVATSEA